jgi:flagellin-like hook-associated protein FlgL
LPEWHSDVGGRVDRAELSAARQEMSESQLTSQLFNIEDADLTRVITKMTASEAVYQSVQAATVRVIRPSLVEFLR